MLTFHHETNQNTIPRDTSEFNPYNYGGYVHWDSVGLVRDYDAPLSQNPQEDSRETWEQHDTKDSTSESDKDAENNGTRVVLSPLVRIWAWSSWIHLLPFAISIILVLINVRRTFWYDFLEEGEFEAPSWTIRWLRAHISVDMLKSMFQLAAKIYELLVFASLSELTLSLLRRQLIRSRLPLGLLTAGYRVGQVPYIFSSQFFNGTWSRVFSSRKESEKDSESVRRRTRVWFAVLILVNTIIVLLAGPASAILIIPEQDWFPSAKTLEKLSTPFYYAFPPNKTWSTAIHLNDLRDDGMFQRCERSNGYLLFWCPTAFYPALADWVSTMINFRHFDANSTHYPRFILPDYDGQFMAREVEVIATTLTTNISSSPFQIHTRATTISIPSFLTINRFVHVMSSFSRSTLSDIFWLARNFKLKTTDASRIFQPYVQSTCRPYIIEEIKPGDTIYFPTDGLECFQDKECEKALSKPAVTRNVWWNTTGKPQPRLMFAPANMETGSEDDYYGPFRFYMELPYRLYSNNTFRRLIIPCSVIAHWMPSSLTFTPRDYGIGQTGMIKSNFTVPRFDNTSVSMESLGPGRFIKIHWTWMYDLLQEIYFDPGLKRIDALREYKGMDMMLMSILGSTHFPERSTKPEESFYAVDIQGLQEEKDLFSPNSSFVLWNEDFQRFISAAITEGIAHSGSAAWNYVVTSYNDTALNLVEIGNVWPNITSFRASMGHGPIEQMFVEKTVTWTNGKMDYAYELNLQAKADTGSIDPNLEFKSPQEYLDHLQTFTDFHFEVERFGYGTGIRGTSRILALTLVGVYLSIITIYFLHITFISPYLFRDPLPTIQAWEDITNLILLAWNSKPTADDLLGRSTIDVQSRKAWGAEIGIRADETTGRTLLATARDGGSVLEKNVKYY